MAKIIIQIGYQRFMIPIDLAEAAADLLSGIEEVEWSWDKTVGRDIYHPKAEGRTLERSMSIIDDSQVMERQPEVVPREEEPPFTTFNEGEGVF